MTKLTKQDVDNLVQHNLKTKDKTLFLHGGGLDSVAYLEILHDEGNLPDFIAHINYGQKAAQDEIEAILEQTHTWDDLSNTQLLLLKDLSLKWLNNEQGLLFGNGENPRLDARNLMLVLTGLQYADKVYLGITIEPLVAAFEDEHWVSDTEIFLNRNFPGRNNSIELLVPGVSKERLLRKAYAINNRLFDIAMTCWLPVNNKECGKCSHCLGKQEWITKITGK